MNGIRYITDHRNRKQAIIIDLKTFRKHRKEIEDFLDVLIAESRSNEPSIPWEMVQKRLKKQGKL